MQTQTLAEWQAENTARYNPPLREVSGREFKEAVKAQPLCLAWSYRREEAYDKHFNTARREIYSCGGYVFGAMVISNGYGVKSTFWLA